MNYGVLAGFLVTLSFLLLAIESAAGPRSRSAGKGFVIFYGAGVLFWILLAVIMDMSSLVVISTFQILFLSLFSKLGIDSDESE